MYLAITLRPIFPIWSQKTRAIRFIERSDYSPMMAFFTAYVAVTIGSNGFIIGANPRTNVKDKEKIK